MLHHAASRRPAGLYILRKRGVPWQKVKHFVRTKNAPYDLKKALLKEKKGPGVGERVKDVLCHI